MSRHAHRRPKLPRLFTFGLVAVLIVSVWSALFGQASGARLAMRSVVLSSSEVSATGTYEFAFTTITSGNLGSIKLEFCSDDPYPDTPCTPPVGFSAANALLTAQSGITGFSSSSSGNRIVLSRSPQPESPKAAVYRFSGITNPSSPGSYYVRVSTYATADTSGNSSDYGGLAFAINNSLRISAEVPPYLIFCSALEITNFNCATSRGASIDFGELASTKSSAETSQLLAATNAQSGYTIVMAGTTMTSGTNIITPLFNQDVSRPGVSQFGVNLRDNSTPEVGKDPIGPGTASPQTGYAQPNFYRFRAGETLVSSPTADDIRQYTVSYMVNVSNVQPPGIYVTTLTYVCLANF